MASPKLFTALNILTKEEWSSLRKYILVHTRSESNNNRCFGLLLENKKHLLVQDFEESLRQKHFSQISSKSFSNILSKLFQLFEDWFAIQSFQDDPYAKELTLIKNYNQRGLFHLADKLSDTLEAQILKSEHLDLYHNEILAKIYHNQYYSSNPIKRKNKNLLSECIDLYTKGIIDRSSAYLMDIIHYTNIRDIDLSASIEILESLMELIPSTDISSILKCAIRLLENKSVADFEMLKSALENNTLDSHSDLYLILTIYLRRSSIDIWHRDQLFDTNNILIAHQLSFVATENNKHQRLLPVNLFNGVSSLATMLSYDATKTFIDKWVPKVHTAYRESVIKYCNALNAFRHEKYEEIPQLVSGLRFDNQEYTLICQLLNIIAMYKSFEENLFLNLIKNFRKQLKRNSPGAPATLIVRVENLLKIIIEMNKSRRDKSIKISIEKYQPLFYHLWVVKELKG